MEDWKRLMESEEDVEKRKRLGEAKKDFSASMDKLSEELVALRNVH